MYYTTHSIFKTLGVAIVCLFLSQASAQEFSIGSYNIRYDNPADGDNSWSNRKEDLVNQLLFYQADILGLQEVLPSQRLFIDHKLDSLYSSFGRSRGEKPSKEEQCPIYWKKDLYTKLEAGTFWLSETPNVPSIGWDAALPRTCTFVRLEHKKTNKKLLIFNIHLTWNPLMLLGPCGLKYPKYSAVLEYPNNAKPLQTNTQRKSHPSLLILSLVARAMSQLHPETFVYQKI